MLTIRQIELINKYEFVETTLNRSLETFVVNVATLEVYLSIIMINLIRKLFLATLEQDNPPTELPIEYSDFLDMFSLNLAIELVDCTRINGYAIKFVEDKSSFYDLIYSLSSIE